MACFIYAIGVLFLVLVIVIIRTGWMTGDGDDR